MNGTVSPQVIGETCDFGGCSAPQRMLIEFGDGELAMCQHHWHHCEDSIVVLSGYVRAIELQSATTCV